VAWLGHVAIPFPHIEGQHRSVCQTRRKKSVASRSWVPSALTATAVPLAFTLVTRLKRAYTWLGTGSSFSVACATPINGFRRRKPFKCRYMRVTAVAMNVSGADFEESSPTRRVFASRALDLANIKVIGYDLDYTLLHYRVEAWEGAVYEESKKILRRRGFDVDDLKFDHQLVSRGLVIDSECGNVVQVDRHGTVKRAMHGTRMLDPSEVKELYGHERSFVDLREGRWHFLNTLFSVASACLFSQLTEKVECRSGISPTSSSFGIDYRELFRIVKDSVTEAHVESSLKESILQDPSQFVVLDSEAPRTLLDQKLSGKKIVLITNNDWVYVQRMMAYAYDRYLPRGLTWRSLFDIIITNAKKPDFWRLKLPCWHIVDEEKGLASSTPVLRLKVGGVYCGGNAQLIEECCQHDGGNVMYVGDHIYEDTNISKKILHWRTCLVMRELEEEVRALALSQARRRTLGEKLVDMDKLKQEHGQLLVQAALMNLGFSPPRNDKANETGNAQRQELGPEETPDNLKAKSNMYKMAAARLSSKIKGLENSIHEEDATSSWVSWGINPRWGFLTRVAMHEKSHLMRQVEKYADIYTSRVSNLLTYTPHAYFRAPLQSDRQFLNNGDEKHFSDFLSKMVQAWGPIEEAFAIEQPQSDHPSWGPMQNSITRELLDEAADK